MTPPLPSPKGDLQVCPEDIRHQDTSKGEKKRLHLEDWDPIRPSTKGYPPKGDLLIGARSREVRLEMKTGMGEGE